MTNECRPCPFCGGTDLRQDRCETWVKCSCGAEGPAAVNGSQKGGREKWNARANPEADALRAEVARMQGERVKPKWSREDLVDMIEDVVSETHDLDVRDEHYAENIVRFFEKSADARSAITALAPGDPA